MIMFHKFHQHFNNIFMIHKLTIPLIFWAAGSRYDCEPLDDCNAEPQCRSKRNTIAGRINRQNFPQELPARTSWNALCQEARCALFTSQGRGRNWAFSRKAVLTRVFRNYQSRTEIYPKVWPYFLMNLRGLYRYFELDVPPKKISCYGPLSVVEKLIVTNVAMDSTL